MINKNYSPNYLCLLSAQNWEALLCIGKKQSFETEREKIIS